MTEEPHKNSQRPDIDMEWVQNLYPAAALLGMKNIAYEERMRELAIANLVRDYLIKHTSLTEELRTRIHMEIIPTDYETHYFAQVVIDEINDENSPRTLVCFEIDGEKREWGVIPLPGALAGL